MYAGQVGRRVLAKLVPDARLIEAEVSILLDCLFDQDRARATALRSRGFPYRAHTRSRSPLGVCSQGQAALSLLRKFMSVDSPKRVPCLRRCH